MAYGIWRASHHCSTAVSYKALSARSRISVIPWGSLHGLFQHAHVPTAGRHMPVAELVVHDDILLRPEHDHRLVAARPVIGHGGGVLVTLHERGIHIQGGRPRPRPALAARDQRAIGDVQPRQGRGLPRDRRRGPGRPQGAVLHVEGLEEVPHGGRGGQRMPEQGRQGLILAEHCEVLAAVPTARPEYDEALDELRGGQPALALLDGNMGIDRGRDPKLAEQLDHERDSRAAGDQRRVNRVVDLKWQPRGLGRHHAPPSVYCTHWVKTSKPNASAADRLGGRQERDSPDCSLS